MDVLIIFGLMIWWIVSSISKAQKVAQQTAKRKAAAADAAPKKKPAQSATYSAMQTSMFDRSNARKSNSNMQTPYEGGSLGEYIPMQSMEGQSAYRTLTHRMEDIGERRGSLDAEPRGEYLGSLGISSTEGVDLCDASLNHTAPTLPREGMDAYESSPTESVPRAFDTQALIQGIVMSEILTRPAQRKWGRA